MKIRVSTTVSKGRERWTFTWAMGDEAALVRAIGELAASPQSSIDWEDARGLTAEVAPGFQHILDEVNG